MDEVKLTGWSQYGQPIETPSGYNLHDYFSPNGEFLGPDEAGIAPVFAEQTQNDN